MKGRGKEERVYLVCLEEKERKRKKNERFLFKSFHLRRDCILNKICQHFPFKLFPSKCLISSLNVLYPFCYSSKRFFIFLNHSKFKCSHHPHLNGKLVM